MRKVFCLVLIFSVSIAVDLHAFDNKKSHQDITRQVCISIEENLNYFLNNYLNLPRGLGHIANEKELKAWLEYGAYMEDKPDCRASNHFHNPRNDLPWFDAGLTDLHPIATACDYQGYPSEDCESAIHWATDYWGPAPNSEKLMGYNRWRWDDAREKLYIYLTGNDMTGTVVAGTESAREIALANSFRALGQVLHLIQDMAVPSHVRNDFKSHVEWKGLNFGSIKESVHERFEDYVKEHPESITSLTTGSGGDLTDKTITNFWDTNNYTGVNPEISLEPQRIGLAEYTNINFASRNTVFAEDVLSDGNPSNDIYYQPYPRKSSTNVQQYLDRNLLPVVVIGEDNVPDTSFYIKKTGDGEVLTHFIKPSYLSTYFTVNNEMVFYRSLDFDDECLKEQASKLLPKAVGYSAALLKYFFRGTIYITPPQNGIYALYDPKEHNNEPLNEAGFSQIKLSAMNVASDEELMNNGSIELVVKYKVAQSDPFVTGDVPSGEFQYAVASEKSSRRDIPRSSLAELTFDFPNKIPMYATDVSFYLVYRGDLGKSDYFEQDAVAIGFTDASEPTPYDFLNNMDRVCINGGWLQAGSQQAIQAADANGNGIVDPREWDIFPHYLTGLSIRFFPYQTATVYPPPADFSVATLHPGQSDRVFVIAEGRSNGGNIGYVSYGMSSCNATVFSPEDRCSHGYWPQTARLQLPAIKRQKDEYADEATCSSYGLVTPCVVYWRPQFPTTFRGKQYWALRYYNFSFPYGGSYCLFDQDP